MEKLEREAEVADGRAKSCALNGEYNESGCFGGEAFAKRADARELRATLEAVNGQ